MPSKRKTTATKEEAKSALVPKLRFPEFRGDWTCKPFDDLYSFKRNNALSRDKLNYEVGSVKNVHYGDIHTKFGSHFDIARELVPYINDTESVPPDQSDTYCEEGDLIFADASEDTNDVGKCIEIVNLHGERLLAGLHTILARRNDNRIIVGFGGHLFRSGYLRTQIQREAQGTKVYAISATRIRNLRVAYPSSLAEQQKIAECLSSLDELLGAQGRRVEALRTHKKGLMQQLFPREGETQPRLRFPEFQNAGDWEVKRAGDLFVNRISKGEKGLPIYSVTMHEGMVRRDSLDRNYYDIEEAAGNKLVRENDIAYNMMRMWQGAMGVAPEDCVVSPAYIVLSPSKETVPVFFEYLFKLPSMLLLLTSHSRGLTKDRLRLYFDDFAQIPISCPTAAEQLRIASFLNSLDALVATQSDKLESLKSHKKGLLQQLFPSPREITR